MKGWQGGIASDECISVEAIVNDRGEGIKSRVESRKHTTTYRLGSSFPSKSGGTSIFAFEPTLRRVRERAEGILGKRKALARAGSRRRARQRIMCLLIVENGGIDLCIWR